MLSTLSLSQTISATVSNTDLLVQNTSRTDHDALFRKTAC